MKMVKSLLLGTAAGLVAVAGAQAADMPVKAKPVQYVKICSLYGDGFYYIPGTDTCLKLGGYLRVQAEYNAGAGGIVVGSGGPPTGGGEASQGRFTRDLTNDVNYRTRAVMSLDVRQQTEYGTLRTYLRFGAENVTPAFATAPFFDRGFLQFAGFTVGKTQSFFDLFTHGGGMNYINVRTAGDTGAAGITVWAYTAQFGNGVSGTVSIEDPNGHNKMGTVDANQTNSFGFGSVAPDNAFNTNANGSTTTGSGTIVTFNTPTAFGFRMPDVIANLRMDQAWGFIGISGAIHDASGAYYSSANGAAAVSCSGAANAGANCVNFGHPSDKMGWAAAIGGQLNLPGGDQIGANFVYSEGAAGYATNSQTWMLYNAGNSAGFGWLVDGVFINTAAGASAVELTKVWSVNAGYQHIWPGGRWRTSLYGGYVNIDYNSTATDIICGNRATMVQPLALAPAATFNCQPDFSFYMIGTRTQYNPVPQLDIGLDVVYTKLNSAFRGTSGVNAVQAQNGGRPAVTLVDDQNVWSALFRWQRNFYP